MTMTSTYDHRIIQGAESGLFLQAASTGCSAARTSFYADVFGAMGARAADVSDRGDDADRREAAGAPPAGTATDGDAYEQLKAVAAGMALVKAYRHFGHMAAHLDPLGAEPVGDPALDPGPLGLSEANMARVPAELMRIYVPGATLAEALPQPPGDVHRHHRLRGRAHRLPRGARLAAPRHRVR